MDFTPPWTFWFGSCLATGSLFLLGTCSVEAMPVSGDDVRELDSFPRPGIGADKSAFADVAFRNGDGGNLYLSLALAPDT